uniref:Uncharacterized protein n=1 Tax=Glossina brevipalpis TaxID=37001 RepID=A0A1A9X212_9MUSC
MSSRSHILFTDFIDFMHSKVTELRGRADETSKTVMTFVNEGLEPPSYLDCNFEMLTLCTGKFYKNNKVDPSLCMEYWGPLDVSQASSKSTTRSVSLFKFIRLAGKLLPRTLFVSYLKMIARLSCYEQSAYYSNLRQVYCSSSETIYRNRAINRSINPNEVEELTAVLEVVRSVAEYDEVVRVVMCEHPNWSPLYTLTGLLMYAIPLNLKADILVTLAGLAKSKETANLLWNNLQAMQLISTIPSTNTHVTGNIVLEIEQNECRFEKYPLIAGMLDLLYSLITSGIPKKFRMWRSRNYKDPIEKWIICIKCLQILHYLLDTYEVKVQHFEVKRNSETSPEFYIMLQLQTKTDLLHTCKNIPGKIHVEDCALYCLKIIHRTFVQETASLRNLEFINDVEVNLYRIQKLMLSVLNRFIVSDSNFKDMMKPETITYEPNEENKALHMKYFLEIAANVILYSHLDIYLRFNTSNIQDNSCYESVRNLESTIGIKITRADLLILKQTLVSIFNETFSKQLCSIIENGNEKYAEFNYVLLR